MSEAATNMREMVDNSRGSSAGSAIGWPIASGSDDG
jgi:hypothetical protein